MWSMFSSRPGQRVSRKIRSNRVARPGGRKLNFELLEERVVPTLSFIPSPRIPDTNTGSVLAPITVHTDSPTGVPITLSLSEDSGGGMPILGGTVTQMSNASGNAVFNNLFVYGGTAKNAVLTASSGADLAASNAFQVKPGGANLYFSFNFTTTVAGATLGTITIQVLDSNGGVNVADNTTQIQLSLNNNPGGAQFRNATSGAIVAPPKGTAVRGVITFQNLALDKAGVGYTLLAQATNNNIVTAAITNPFDIVAAAPAALSFLTQPTYTGISDRINNYPASVGHTWNGIVVDVVDRFGNQVTGGIASGGVTLSALDPTGKPAMFSTDSALTQPLDPAALIASFLNLNIVAMGNGYTLLASGSLKVGANTIQLGASTTLAANGAASTIKVSSFSSFPTSNNYLISVSQGTTQKTFQVTAGAGTATWTINGDASGFTSGATVTLFAATSVPFNIGPQRGVGSIPPKAVKFITPPPPSFAAGQTLVPNEIVTMSGNGVSPIVITYAGHGLATGQKVSISGATGNTAANGIWTVTRIDDNSFSLDSSTGNGVYAGGATWSLIGNITTATGSGPTGPIVIASPTAGLVTGNTVIITGNSLAAANGKFSITVIDANSFSLTGTSGSGSGTGGSWLRDASAVQVAVIDSNGNVITADNTDRIALAGGRFLGTRTITVVDGVATFSDLLITGSQTLNESLAMQFGYADLPNGSVSQNVTVLPGVPYSLAFKKTDVATTVAGNYLKDTTGNPLEVDVVDNSGNVVTTDQTSQVTIGILANNGRGPVFVGYSQTDPGSTDPSVYGVQYTGTVTNGRLVLPFLYMNLVGTGYILAAGTTQFASHAAAATLGLPGFTITPGVASTLKFGNGVGDTTADNAFNFTGTQPIPGVSGLVVVATDRVGNVATSFTGSVSLQLNPENGATGTLAGVTTATAFQGFAIFNQAYVNQTGGPMSYSLTASSDGVASGNSNSFKINPPNFTGTPAVSISQPGTQKSGVPFVITATITGGATPNQFDDTAHVVLELRDKDGNPLLSGPFIVPNVRKAPTNGVVTFSISITPKSSQSFTIIAYLDLNAGAAQTTPFLVDPPPDAPTDLSAVTGDHVATLTWRAPAGSIDGYNLFRGTSSNGEGMTPINTSLITTNSFTDTNLLDFTSYYYFVQAVNSDGSSPDSNEASVTPMQLASTSSGSGIIQYGLGSLTDNFDTLVDNPVYQSQTGANKNLPPSDTSGNLLEPNVADGFDQVAQSSDWWSSLIFPRNQVDPASNLPRDSQNNQLYPLYAGPLTAMVNSNPKGSTTAFAGLGLSYLTNLYVTPSPAFLDPPTVPAGQPQVWANPQAPGAAAFSYPYDGNSNSTLYQDFSVGLQGVQADGKVLGYSDWTVTLDWQGKNASNLAEELQATLGQGLPYAYFTAPTATDASNNTVQLVTTPKINDDQSVVQLTVTTYQVAADGTRTPVANGTGKFEMEIKYTLFDARNQFRQTGGTTMDSDMVSVQDATKLAAGMSISGPGINAGATILKVLPGNMIQISSTASATGGGVSLVFNTPQTYDQFYGVYLPDQIGWTTTMGANGNITIAANLTSKNFLSVATLPDGTGATFNYYAQHAYSFVTGSISSFNVDPNTGKVTTTYTLQSQQKQNVAGTSDTGPLQALMANQYNNLAPDQAALLTHFSYVSPQGERLIWNGSSFRTQLQYTGVLPEVPPLPQSNSDGDLYHNYLLPILQSIALKSPAKTQSDGQLQLDQLFPNDNNYLQAQAMYGASQLVPILLEISTSTDPALSANDKLQASNFAEQIYNQVKARMGSWLSVTDDQALQLLYYQPATLPENPSMSGWNTLLSILGGFLSAETLNDHQLINGYFVKVAAFLTQYDPTWGQSSITVQNGMKTLEGKMGDIINLMIGDVANYDRSSTVFPFLRNFDVFAGHSWADGAANSSQGTNLESSSEAMNFDASVIQWGQATGNLALTNLGIYMYTTENEAVNTFWFSQKNKVDPFGNPTNVIPENYLFYTDPSTGVTTQRRTLVTELFSGGGSYTGFIGTQTSNVTGIQLLPLSGSAYYLGQATSFVQQTYDLAQIGNRAAGVQPVGPPTYQSLLIPYLAFVDPTMALALYEQNLSFIPPINPNDYIDNAAFNIHWIEVLQQYGQVDSSITANTVSYQVFKNPTSGDRTFVAYNPGTTPLSVTFTGTGVKLTVMVPARSIGVYDATGTSIAGQTNPDYSFQTPQNRFMFTNAPDGSPTMTNGQTGPGESAVNLPADGTLTSFTISGLSGSLQGPQSQVYFDLWLDAQFRTNATAPIIQVTVTIFSSPTDTVGKKFLYDVNPIAALPGYVEFRSPANGGLIGDIPALPLVLTNGRVTISFKVTGGDGTTPVRLRTNAAAQQGRISYIDLPYNLTQVNGVSTEEEVSAVQDLGDPLPQLNSSIALFSAAPVVAQNGFDAVLAGTTATFTATSVANQTLIITVDPLSGLLMNNRFAAGDPDFASPYDFDSTQPGVQSLDASASSTVIVQGANGDSIVLGGRNAAASSLLATFELSTTDGTGSVTVNDSASASGDLYFVQTGSGGLQIRTSDNSLNATLSGQAFSGGVFLTSGRAANLVEVSATRAGESLTLDSAGTSESVLIGAEKTKDILGSITINNTSPGGFTNVFILNEDGTNFASSVVISATSVVGMAPAPIFYSSAAVDDLQIFGGTNATNYQVTGSLGGSFLELFGGNNADTFNIGNNGVVNSDFFPGQILVDSSQTGSNLVIDNHLGAAVTADVTDQIAGFTSSGISYSHVNALELDLGSADPNSVAIDTTDNPVNVAVNAPGVLSLGAVAMQGNLAITTMAGDLNLQAGVTVGDLDLSIAGAIHSQGDTTPLTSTGIVVHEATGLGTSASPLVTATGFLAASVGNGGVFVHNTGILTIGTDGAVAGIQATGGAIDIETSGDLSVSSPVSTGTSAGDDVLLKGNGAIDILAPITGSTAKVLGGAGNDAFKVMTATPIPLTVDGQGGANSLAFDSKQNPLLTAPGTYTVLGQQAVQYANFATLTLNNASSVNTFYGPNTADRGQALQGLNAQERFVQVLYLDVLGRAGAKSEIDFWAGLLGAGTSQGLVANQIEHSGEAREHLVTTWYQTYLGRTPHNGEESFWVGQLTGGQNEATVLDGILGTQEFFNHAPALTGHSGAGTNELFVEALYQVLLNRTAEGAALEFWENEIASIGRSGVAQAIQGSLEGRTAYVEALYNALLHRPSDPTGLDSWLSSNLDATSIRVGFEGTDEFFKNG